jgi:hypothetical protein
MFRPRRPLGLATVLLLGALVPGTAPALAVEPAAEPDHTITVAPTASGPAIDDTMYGVFFEDINFAGDGGLYPELIRNRSFEFSPVDNAAYTPLTAWTAVSEGDGAGTVTTADDAARLNERNRRYLTLALSNPAGGRYGVTNSGYNSGLAVRAGAAYNFSVWARTDAPAGTPLSVALRDAAGEPLAAPVQVIARRHLDPLPGDRDRAAHLRHRPVLDPGRRNRDRAAGHGLAAAA